MVIHEKHDLEGLIATLCDQVTHTHTHTHAHTHTHTQNSSYRTGLLLHRTFTPTATPASSLARRPSLLLWVNVL